MLFGVGIEILGGLILILQGLLSELKAKDFCKVPIFLILRAGGEIIVFFFLAIGILLTYKLKQI